MTQQPLRFSKPSHAARVEASPRLQRALAALRRFGSHGCTTAQLFHETGSMAVHSDVSELRANGYTVECKHERTENGRRVYRYTLRGEAA